MADTYWQDLGNEVMGGVANVGSGLFREITMREDSYNQRACEGFADVLTWGCCRRRLWRQEGRRGL